MCRMRVALTFDAEHPDRPSAGPPVQEEIIDILARRALRATFFLQGRWAEAYPDTARRIADDGHAIGSHSFYHAHMPLLSPDGVSVDVRRAEEAIGACTGVDPHPWFRLPFGSGWDDPNLLSMLGDMGYDHVGWDVVGFDWEPGSSPSRSSGWSLTAWRPPETRPSSCCTRGRPRPSGPCRASWTDSVPGATNWSAWTGSTASPRWPRRRHLVPRGWRPRAGGGR